jgi:hypothetical protein
VGPIGSVPREDGGSLHVEGTVVRTVLNLAENESHVGIGGWKTLRIEVLGYCDAETLRDRARESVPSRSMCGRQVWEGDC